MYTSPIPQIQIITDRLVLRPTSIVDADRAFEIQSDWDVTRMLRMASFPPDRKELRRWFADHRREWLASEAYRFAIELENKMIGVVDVDEIRRPEGHLGYWLEQAAWGSGYALEAAHAVVRFAFEEVGLSTLWSGHAVDNPRSAKVLAKLGFDLLDTVQLFSHSRGENVLQCRYLLTYHLT